jgi:Zn-dependent protease with chaperone function
MNEGTLAIILNTITIIIITFIIANLVVSIIASLITELLLTIQVKPRIVALWLLVTLPWLAGLCVALLFLNEYISSNAFESEAEDAHWHHMDVFNWLTWHGATLIIALVFSLYVLGGKLIQLKNHRNNLKSLTSLSKNLSDDVFEIEMSEASAFTAGFIHKKCYITSGMLKEMTKDEISVVLEHEKAHAKNNDPLKKWMFSIFTVFFISSLATRLKLHMTLAMEQAADNEVVSDGVNSTFVTITLVRVARLNALYSPVKDNELVANFGAEVLEQRIYFLLLESIT